MLNQFGGYGPSFHRLFIFLFQKFFVNIGKASLQLDELLLWKLVQFAEFDAKNMLDQASQLNIEPEKYFGF